MKKIIFMVVAAVIFMISFSCSNSGHTITREDSLAVAKAILKSYPDTIPQLELHTFKNQRLAYALPSTIIDDKTARKAHLDYLTSGGIKNSAGDIVHSLWISKSDLQVLDNNSIKGARLNFCLDNTDTGTYIGIIMVPLDANNHNILYDAGGKFAIINKLEPCPNQCPEGDFGTTPNDQNDLNFDKYGQLLHQGLWYKPKYGGWVDKNNVPK